MNQFAYRRDLGLKTRDLMQGGDALGLGHDCLVVRKRRTKAFQGCYFADLSPVVASITYTGSKITALSGEALTLGQAVYVDSSGLWWRSAAATSGKDATAGIALSTCSAAGQNVVIGNDGVNGQIVLGCAVAAAAIYIASSNLGGIVLYVDGTTPTTSWKTCIIGVGISTTVIKTLFVASGVAHL